MIKELLIKNFILIDELKLEFDSGFNVFLGETGAGKSIILKAIDIALGAKTSKDVLKDPSKNALIEITFKDNDDETVISREISNTGTKCRFNGALVTLDTIKEQRQYLVDIHSQHQTYNILQPKYQLELLDSYISKNEPEYKNILDTYKITYNEYKEKSQKFKDALLNKEKNAEHIEYLKFQIDEIEKARIKENEEDELNNELDFLSNIEELKKLTYSSYWTLGGDDASILDALNKISYTISKAARYDNELNDIQNIYSDSLENLKDVSNTLRSYSENLDFNPQRLDEVNLRLDTIQKLKRKYGNIFETYEKLVKELELIECNTYSVENLEEQLKLLEAKIKDLSEKISAKRQNYAKNLSEKITQELLKLEFQKAEFKIEVKNCEINTEGIDTIEFLISTNVSKDLSLLAKAASGGEISRVMLAIKTVFSAADKVKTLIFDEIDTGISGKTSVSVANAILNLSKMMQIFAVTHQPIIASKACSYYWVSKEQDDLTKIYTKKLTDEEKPLYLAMLASGEVSDNSVSFAKELLNN